MVGMVRRGWWLDWMISLAFSNINDSIILSHMLKGWGRGKIKSERR